MPPTPKVLLAFRFPFLARIPGPRGTQRATGQVPGALGSDRPAAPGAGRGGARPHLRLGFPPPSLWTELAGPHRLLGSLCLINGAGDSWGTERRNAQLLWPGTAAAPLSTGPHATGLREPEPAGGRIGKWELCLAGPSPLPQPAFSACPRLQRVFSFIPN